MDMRISYNYNSKSIKGFELTWRLFMPDKILNQILEEIEKIKLEQQQLRRLIEGKNNPIKITTNLEKNKLIEQEVENLMSEIGVPTHIEGYKYLRDAILMAVNDFDLINSITKHIYPGIASEYGISRSRVERAIRHAIEVAWSRGQVDTILALLGHNSSIGTGQPTNTEFIAMVADKLRLA